MMKKLWFYRLVSISYVTILRVNCTNDVHEGFLLQNISTSFLEMAIIVYELFATFCGLGCSYLCVDYEKKSKKDHYSYFLIYVVGEKKI